MKFFVLLVVMMALFAMLCSAQPFDRTTVELPEIPGFEQKHTTVRDEPNTSDLEQPNTSDLEQPNTSDLEQPDASNNLRHKRFLHREVKPGCGCPEGKVFLYSHCLSCDMYLDLTGEDECPKCHEL